MVPPRSVNGLAKWAGRYKWSLRGIGLVRIGNSDLLLTVRAVNFEVIA